MRALLIGYGKMGKLLVQLAPQFSIEVTAIVAPSLAPSIGAPSIGYSSLTPEAIDACDIAFDFASADGIIPRIEALAKAKKPMIIGTTGWEKSYDEAKRIVKREDATLLTSPNFSLGVALFLRLAHDAAYLLSHFREYDVAMHEEHHRHKKDSPSGTAKAMASNVLKHYPNKKLIHNTPESEAISNDAIQLSSMRLGAIPGTHSLLFDAPEDTISITHTARNREGFVKGALSTARWLVDKKGWFTLDDLITDKLQLKGNSP